MNGLKVIYNGDTGMKTNCCAKIYDPIIGRFLSPDPVLQDPANAQNYNKYSYVLNNPLKFTDPSGYKVGGNGPGFAHWWYIQMLKIKRATYEIWDDPFDDPLSSGGDFYDYGTSGGGGGGGAPLGGSAASGPGSGGGGAAPLNLGGDGGPGDPLKGNAATDRPHKNYLYKFPSKKPSSSVPVNNSAIINDGSGPGIIISGVNGTAACGAGGMFDVGIARDSYGNKRGYITFGGVIGYGQSLGSGLFFTSPYFHINDLGGFGGGGSFSLFGPFSIEVVGNIDHNAVNDLFWNRYFAVGGNVGGGQFWGGYLSYTWLFDLPSETERGFELFIKKNFQVGPSIH